MKKTILIVQVIILVAALLSIIGVNHSQAAIYDFQPGWSIFEPSMALSFQTRPYVDGTYYVDGEYIGGLNYIESSMPHTLGLQADTDNLTADVDWHYDALSVSGSYSGQLLFDIIPGGFGSDTYVYLPFTIQYQATTNSYDSSDTINIDPNALTFDWDSPSSQYVDFSGQINVNGNIGNFALTHPTSTPSWTGSGVFNTAYYPEGLIVNLSRNNNTAKETIFDQTINGKQIKFELSSQLGFNGRFYSGNVPLVAVAPEPISSTLFIVGGAVLGFRSFRKKFKK
jgi:hypothetical protein